MFHQQMMPVRKRAFCRLFLARQKRNEPFQGGAVEILKRRERFSGMENGRPFREYIRQSSLRAFKGGFVVLAPLKD